MSIQPPSTPATLFYSYTHEDEELRDQLDKHVRLLQWQGYLSTWHDRALRPGDNWAKTIDAHLESAQIILLLMSADFLASEYCYSVEMQRAFERHSLGEACVIPIILRPVDWRHDPNLSRLQALPTDGKPVTTWPGPPHYDAAFEDIAKGLRQVVEDLPSGQYQLAQKVLAGKGRINQRLQEQRRETCLRLLVSVREFVLIAAEFRQAHDDLWVRQGMLLNGWQLEKNIKVRLHSIQEKLALAGSELTHDPDGKAVMDAFLRICRLRTGTSRNF
jgi:hypothetical protein